MVASSWDYQTKGYWITHNNQSNSDRIAGLKIANKFHKVLLLTLICSFFAFHYHFGLSNIQYSLSFGHWLAAILCPVIEK